MAPSDYGMQKLLDILYKRFYQLGLLVDVEKCEYMVFNSKKSSCLTTVLTMIHKMLRKVSEFKYLGLILSEDMCNAV